LSFRNSNVALKRIKGVTVSCTHEFGLGVKVLLRERLIAWGQHFAPIVSDLPAAH
jgi:hypothetical protein